MTHSAATLVRPGQFELTQRNAPMPGPSEITLRIRSVGVCGSDIHMFQDGRIGDTKIENPLVLGHEFMGEVIQAFPGAVDAEGHALPVGTRVAVEPHVACGHCRACQEGHPNLCPDHTFMGVYPRDGALQHHLAVPAHNCFVLPTSISNDAGALLEPLGVALHALRLGKVTVGDRVAVIGAGPIGLLLVKLLRQNGLAELHVMEPLAWRRDLALQWGATSVAPEYGPSQDALYDVVFEAAWAGEAVQQAALLARPGARVVLVGIPGDDSCTVQHALARRKGLTLKFARRMKHTYPTAIALLERGLVTLDDLVSDVFSLEDVQTAFERQAKLEPGVVKVMVHPS
ncbi:zinc-dependent alcohol dehydrogenase [Deinococcus hopiensis]|uniref:L-iditol 2-dehydrogenase n=1 Tax=Deinococcus hopiensis KR-140 TaxID=695939 RepID=A0A1W1VWL7_9DEIO|nr:alcohol dehydrogenase catalytic domain-containing protein [Deinococcus hopiensis]SMB97762.1 L-iditol 2-dehydrogenase [Deinococcus hopiensis KR-140]